MLVYVVRALYNLLLALDANLADPVVRFARDYLEKRNILGICIDLISGVSCQSPYEWINKTDGEWDFNISGRHEGTYHVVAYDFGIKQNILWRMASQGRPSAVPYAVDAVKALLGRAPIFGICMGHRLLGQALGGKTFKMKFGHHGGNHPVRNLRNDLVDISSQLCSSQLQEFIPKSCSLFPSHYDCFLTAPLLLSPCPTIFMFDPDILWGIRYLKPTWIVRQFLFSLVGRASLPDGVEVTNINLNDGSCAGLAFPEKNFMSLQYCPEASPGPHDSDPSLEITPNSGARIYKDKLEAATEPSFTVTEMVVQVVILRQMDCQPAMNIGKSHGDEF
ncbi:hypothetical protein Ancab_026776 [Ancistrocladus abbreviatus]